VSGTNYTARITTGAKDLAGNALAADKVWSFTGATTDVTAPTVTFTTPADGDIGVILGKKIYATFDEAMDPATIDATTFTLALTATPAVHLAGTVSYIGMSAIFTPNALLTTTANYTATITTGAKDLGGNPLVVPAVGLGVKPNPWTFTTTATPGAGPVDLGTAADFAILTKTGITNVPPSVITLGNVGTSPISGAAIAGLTCAEVNAGAGIIYTVDNGTGPAPCSIWDATRLTTAVSDMETAYTAAAGRTGPDGTELYAGNLTGQTIPPGLYKWGTGVSVDAAGTVTLAGNATDVWIFQISGDITMNSGSSVALTGGAVPKNVFWQVGGPTGVFFNTGVAFQGIVLAQKAINLTTGATVNGRLLSQTEVTLQSNTITAP
jgi:hypothetical protein